jgi:putative ABC transport system permease protein
VSPQDIIRTAIKALSANLCRALLTALGVAVGTAATTVVAVLGHGARDLLDGHLESVGKNMIVIRPGAQTAEGYSARTPLIPDDVRRLRDDSMLRQFTTGTAEAQATLGLVTAGSLQATTTVDGVHYDAFRIRRWTLEAGRFLTRHDETAAASVCVLGHTVREKLFPRLPANSILGRSVSVGPLRLKVVGVLKARGKDPLGRDHDDELFIPLSLSRTRITQSSSLTVIITVAKDGDAITAAAQRVRKLLRDRRQLRPGEPLDVDVTTVQEMASVGVTTLLTMNVLTIVLSAVALGVGGIGVAATMLATVGERTREIGLRCGLGALPHDIRTTVIAEALFLTGGGGTVGLTAGIVLGSGITQALGWPFTLCHIYMSCSIVALLIVGLLAGAYPALRASRLDPIKALRTD